MKLTNIVGKKTEDYINSLKGKNMDATETKVVVETTTSKETKEQLFMRKAGERLGRAKYAIELVGKSMDNGKGKFTAEQLTNIEKNLIEAISEAMISLKNPVSAAKKQQAKHFVKI